MMLLAWARRLAEIPPSSAFSAAHMGRAGVSPESKLEWCPSTHTQLRDTCSLGAGGGGAPRSSRPQPLLQRSSGPGPPCRDISLWGWEGLLKKLMGAQEGLAGGWGPGPPTFKPISNFLCRSSLSLAGSFPGLAADVRSRQLGRPGTASGRCMRAVWWLGTVKEGGTCPASEACPPETWEGELHWVRHSHMIGVARSPCTETEITPGGGVTHPRPRSWGAIPRDEPLQSGMQDRKSVV